jgi:putative phage-type endonuclease
MKRTNTLPENREAWLALRGQDITSTDVAALFGLSPYKTRLQLWHEKTGGLCEDFQETERMKWGTRLQDTIARGVAEDRGWEVRARNVYSRIEDRRIGSSFDFEILNHPDGPGLLEIKNVDGLVYRNTWTEEDGVVEAPAHIELQLQHQLLVTGRTWGAIVALVGGNDVKVVIRESDPVVQGDIIDECARFWASVQSGVAPEPKYPEDASVVARLHAHANPGEVVDATGDMETDDLVSRYRHVASEIKGLEEIKDSLKAQLLTRIGTAEKVLGNGWSISAGMVEAKEVPAFVRQAYRTFRVNAKKASK